jgi:photosystem II stability/assembly factor-like uncharacterized protein
MQELVSALVIKGTTIFAGTMHEYIYRSTNNGTSWSQIGVGQVWDMIDALTANETTIYTGTYVGAGVYRSVDNGNTWTPVSSYNQQENRHRDFYLRTVLCNSGVRQIELF